MGAGTRAIGFELWADSREVPQEQKELNEAMDHKSQQSTFTIIFIDPWRWYITITSTILEFIHRPVFYFKHTASETGFRLRIQLEPTQLGQIEIASLCLRR
jgi:hypothetical protein